MGLTSFNRRRREVAAAGARAALAAAAPVADITVLDAPPREGRGAGKQAWVDFAAEIGLQHDENATRDEIIELFDALVAQNDARLAAEGVAAVASDALTGSQSADAHEDGDDASTAEAGAERGSDENGDGSHE